MKILITGGAGFVGSYVTEAFLATGYAVSVLDDLSSANQQRLKEAQSKTKRDLLNIVKGSIAEERVWKNLERHDAIIHLASFGPPAHIQSPHEEFHNRVTSIKLMTDWIRDHRVNIVILGSSAEELYGESIHLPTDERTPLHPLTLYGATKAFAELYISALSRSLKDSGEWSSRSEHTGDYFSWSALRFSTLYGARQIAKNNYSGIVSYFVDSFLKGEAPVIHGDGTKTRDYLHISDAVSAIMATFNKQLAGAIDDSFNIGTAIETADIDLYDMVLEQLKTRASSAASSSKLKNCLKIEDPKFLPLRATEAKRVALNVAKAEAILDWRPKVDLSLGIQQTLDAYKF